jgi:hypothetical protein
MTNSLLTVVAADGSPSEACRRELIPALWPLRSTEPEARTPINCCNSSWNRRCANNGFVFVREVGKLSLALGHCHENRGTLKRYLTSLCARGAVGGACAALVRAYHGASPV